MYCWAVPPFAANTMLAGLGFLGYFSASDVPVGLAAALDAATDAVVDFVEPEPLPQAARVPAARVATAIVASKRVLIDCFLSRAGPVEEGTCTYG